MADSSDEDVVDYKNDYIVSDDEEDIMPSEPDSSEDDDDDEDFYNDKFSRFKIELKKDEMASDLEDGDENEDNLPSSLAWGKDKKLFYNTDFIDRDYRSQKSKEEDLAQYEEQEALAIQKRLLESINENDLGLDFMIDTKPKQVTKKQLIEEDYYEKKSEKIELDLSTLKSEQKLDIIRRESPELELLISDCKKYLKELNDQLDPILNNLLENDPISSTGLKYLKLRYMVLLNYCTNVSYYLSLMSSHDKSKDIFMHKKLISQLDSYQKQDGKLFTKELDYVSKLLEQPNPQIDFMRRSMRMQSCEEEVKYENHGRKLGNIVANILVSMYELSKVLNLNNFSNNNNDLKQQLNESECLTRGCLNE
ncbi:Something about silencing protein 10 [Blomia tropicalis]|nr:Something about silencing protein 10 [Blomia tropicalis]